MKIQLKRSNVLSSGAAKTPTASQLEYGELAVNYNNTDPAIFLKDSNNNVIRISGVGNISDDGLTNVPDGTSPPSNPEAGNLWYNSDQGRLYIYFEDADTSQWVDASPDSWDPSSYPDVTNASAQSNTLDDRYAMVNGGNSFTDIVDSNKFFRSTRTASNNGELFFQGKVGSTTNCSLAADGSATFAGAVTADGRVNAGGSTEGGVNFGGLLTATNPFGFFIKSADATRDASNIQALSVYQSDNTNTVAINADGSATFAGSGQFTQAASDQSGGAALKAIGSAYGTNKAIHAYMDTSNANKSLLYLENGSGAVMNVTGSGNVGIGVSNISGSGSLTLLANQSLKFAGSGGNTIYGDISADTSHNIIFKNNNGTERMQITSSGKVGIGETSPAAGLDIKINTNPVLSIDRGTANNANFKLKYNGTDTAALSAGNADFQIVAIGASTPMRFYVNNSQRGYFSTGGTLAVLGAGSAASPAVSLNGSAPSGSLNLASSGNVGIGTTNPLRSLHIVGAGDTGLMLQTTNAVDDNELWEVQAAGNPNNQADLIFRTRSNAGTGGSEKLRITRYSNVGIGNSSPTEKLSVQGALISTSNATNFQAATGALIDYYAGAGLMRIAATGTSGVNNSISFLTSTSGAQNEHFRMNHDGTFYGIDTGDYFLSKSNIAGSLSFSSSIASNTFFDVINTGVLSSSLYIVQVTITNSGPPYHHKAAALFAPSSKNGGVNSNTTTGGIQHSHISGTYQMEFREKAGNSHVIAGVSLRLNYTLTTSMTVHYRIYRIGH